MSQDHRDEMPAEIDFSEGVRGKYRARYERWTSITSAVGTVPVGAVTSGEKSGAVIVIVVPSHSTHISPPLKGFVGPRVAPEVSTCANAG